MTESVMEKQVELWWIMDDRAEADGWRAEIEKVRGGIIVSAEQRKAPDSKIDVVFRLPVREALKHYDVDSLIDNCEFTDEEIAALRNEAEKMSLH